MINKLQKFFKKIRASFIKITSRKHFLDFFIAMISIPVLVTALITNISNLQAKNGKTAETTTTQKEVIIREVPSNNPPATNQVVATVTPIESCKKEIGPISISSPEENEEITDNPVCITIKHDNQNYCTVVWSYRINGGSWSEYSNNSVCLYNVPNGKVKFDLRVQSTVSDDQESLTRNFTYKKESTATSSANLQ